MNINDVDVLKVKNKLNHEMDEKPIPDNYNRCDTVFEELTYEILTKEVNEITASIKSYK